MTIDPANYVRPGNAAKIAGVTRAFIVRLCNDGRIGCFRVCNSWFVSRTDAEKYRTDTPGKVPPKAQVAPPRKQAPVDPTPVCDDEHGRVLDGSNDQVSHLRLAQRGGREPSYIIFVWEGCNSTTWEQAGPGPGWFRQARRGEAQTKPLAKQQRGRGSDSTAATGHIQQMVKFLAKICVS